MNFETLRNKVRIYETKAESSVVASELKELVAKNGLEIFRDPEKLGELLEATKLSAVVKAQLRLIFSCSTLPDFILNTKSDLNMVDMDNAVHGVVVTTGLSYKCAIKLIVDIFYGCGLDFPVEYGPQLVNHAVEYKLHAIMPSATAEEEVVKMLTAYDKYERAADKELEDSKSAATEAVKIMRQLCEAGMPEGFYYLGRCHLYGECGTAVDKVKGMEYMKIAADRGNAAAAAILGDIYYEAKEPLRRSYTLAHHYYTRPGALAVKKERRAALEDIYAQQRANKTTFVFSGLLLALSIVFLIFFHTGIFSGAGRLAVGIVCTALSAVLYGLTVIYHIMHRFNGIRWLTAAQYFLWALYVFVLVLS